MLVIKQILKYRNSNRNIYHVDFYIPWNHHHSKFCEEGPNALGTQAIDSISDTGSQCGTVTTGYPRADTSRYCPVIRPRPAFCKHSLDTQYLSMSQGRQTTQQYSDLQLGGRQNVGGPPVRIVWDCVCLLLLSDDLSSHREESKLYLELELRIRQTLLRENYFRNLFRVWLLFECSEFFSMSMMFSIQNKIITVTVSGADRAALPTDLLQQ